MQIDSYGFEAKSRDFKRRKLEVHLVKRIDGIMYVCFSDAPLRPIHRLDKDEHGSIRLMWAYGSWDEVEALSYIPINETMEITNTEDI